jgi:hypothetical protein
MIGSPAARGAVTSLGGGAGRVFFAAAPSVGATRADIVAIVTRAQTAQRCIAAVDRVVLNRFFMPV